MTANDHPGRALLVALKSAAGRPGPQLGLDIGNGYRLRPVPTERAFQRPLDVEGLTDWRNRFKSAFLAEFEATPPQTAAWLAEIIGPSDDRILFMVDDPDEVPIGYMAISFIRWRDAYGEADAIVRGRDAPKGLMQKAILGMLDWGRGQLLIEKFGVRVRSDNPALEFYHKLGFVEELRVPLTRTSDRDKITWVENPQDRESEIYLVHHVLGERNAAGSRR